MARRRAGRCPRMTAHERGPLCAYRRMLRLSVKGIHMIEGIAREQGRGRPCLA